MYGAVGKMSLDSLKESAAKFSELPEDIDEGYVVGRAFKTSPSGVVSFVIVLSIMRLSTFPVGDAVHSDCTYKSTWNGYPVTIMGISDKNRTFHPIIIAISTHESKREFEFMLRQWKKVNNDLDFKFIVADAAEAVYNAAKLIWPGIVRLMCFAHVHMVRTRITLFFKIIFYIYLTVDL